MRHKKIGILILMAFLIAGCSWFTPAPDAPIQTALQKARLTSLYFMETYKAQFKDAQSMGVMATAGKLSPGQLEVYRTKRTLLIKVEPLIKMFDSLVAGGTIPDQGKEQEINDILNNLLASGSKIGG